MIEDTQAKTGAAHGAGLNGTAERNGLYGLLLPAAIEILSDGKPRSALQILKEAKARNLVRPITTNASLYNDLAAYVRRMIVYGRKPEITLDPNSHEFRVNRPIDDWPEVVLPECPRYNDLKSIEAMALRLEQTAAGDDPAAFEQAVCDAFAMMGFVHTHIGGVGKPDGILDAPLGPLSYRAVVECKSTRLSSVEVGNAHPEEPARFRDACGADYAVLIGPAFKEEKSLLDELVVHKVSLWTTRDLVNAIANDVDPFECRELFAPGPVYDRLGDLEWDRSHGTEKRVRVVAEILRRDGYAAQRNLVGYVLPADAPVLTLDAALLLVEEALRKDGVTNVATRAEVEMAVNDLVRAGEAARVPGRDGVVIRRGLTANSVVRAGSPPSDHK